MVRLSHSVCKVCGDLIEYQGVGRPREYCARASEILECKAKDCLRALLTYRNENH